MEFRQDIAPIPSVDSPDHARRVEEELRRLTWLTWQLRGGQVMNVHDWTKPPAGKKYLTDDQSMVRTTYDITIEFPPANEAKGKTYFIKNMGGGDCQLDVSSKIDDVTSRTISTQYEALTVFSDGTQWTII
jgi:hypothetical protein